MALLFFLEGSKELTLKFSDPAAGLFGGGSVERGFDRGAYRVSGKDFPTTGPRIQAENVEIHRGLHVSDFTVQYVVKHWSGCGSWSLDGEGHTRLIGASFGSTRLMCASFGSTRLICASFGSTRLIGASFGSTTLVCASFGSTRLICASFGSTRLICAFYGTTRLLCRVGAQRGADRREAGRMREGHMDASGFLIASAIWYQSLSFRFCRLAYNVSLCFVSLWLRRSLPLVRDRWWLLGKCRQGKVHVGVAEEAEEGEQDAFSLRCSL
ncbi:hypothetical protein E6C27_scaffold83G00490 [Cucumis melo var. makuwa]|uniref:DNA-directed RNA polymerase I subunit RPA1-like n=1 Tax=Cucumis melo var. makuwa TaxID=1194695 RepID=A0A5A7TW44_CUCMM|nr:hypothetical protein E6C27_scaffold83G00490 [Cucumis melo var. makuwa]